MSSPPMNQPVQGRVSAHESRLDGWKEIAEYLGKAERTAKRWGRDWNLPVHRVPGGISASVFAYPSELDKWLAEGNFSKLETAAPIQDLNSAVGGDRAFDGNGHFASTEALDKAKPSHRAFARWRWTSGALILLAGTALFFFSARFRTWSESQLAKLHFVLSKKEVKENASVAPTASEQDKNEARDLYLKGRYEWNQRTPESLYRALEFFNQSIAHDPGYANAYAGLADTYVLLREYSTASDMDVFPRALAAARKAVELDDSLADAHRSLAFAEMYGSWEFADAEKEFRRAIELNPTDPQVHLWYANAFGVKGRFAEALKQMDKAQELDPSSNATLADKGYLLYNAGETQQAIETLKEVEHSVPAFRSPHAYLMEISFNLRDYPSYLEEGEKSSLASNDPVLRDIIASARAGYERDGANGLLKRLYAKQKEYSQAGRLSGVILAKTCIAMGKRQEALSLLEDAYARHDATVLACLSHPDLLTLKDEPRYMVLVKKINFPALARN